MMIETLALTVVASLTDWPTYTDTQWIHTDDWSARIKVNYYEETNLFEYDILNAFWSTESIEYFDLGNGFVFDDIDIEPASLNTYELTALGGYEHGTGFIGSDNYGTYFKIITPVGIPAPGTLALLGIAGISVSRRRR
jgi:hypothetical protein